jgi:hypothetical protein
MTSKWLQLQLHDFLEHLMTYFTNSTKLFEARTIPNRTLDLINCYTWSMHIIKTPMLSAYFSEEYMAAERKIGSNLFHMNFGGWIAQHK